MSLTFKLATEHWGNKGAGVLLVAPSGRILLLKRSDAVNEPRVWGIPGGKIDNESSPIATINNEVYEETGSKDIAISDKKPHIFKSPDVNFRYGTYLANVSSEFTPQLNFEHDDHIWILPYEVKDIIRGAKVHQNVLAAISHHFPKNKLSFLNISNLLNKYGYYKAAKIIIKISIDICDHCGSKLPESSHPHGVRCSKCWKWHSYNKKSHEYKYDK